MIFSDNETIQDTVLRILLKKSFKANDLLRILEKEGITISRQALYDILRKLTAAEVLVKHQLVYSPNLAWVHKAAKYLTTVSEENEYKEVNYLYDMNDGDSLTFHFSDPVNMDRFWGHIFLALGDTHPQNVPLIIYFPHPWIYYARAKTEKEFFEELKKRYVTFYTIGNNTPLDRNLKKEQESDVLQFNFDTTKHIFDRYICIQGDYIQEVVPSKNFSEEINTIFSLHTTKETITPALQKLLNGTVHKSKLIVRKNRARANELRKRFAREFILPKGYSVEVSKTNA